MVILSFRKTSSIEWLTVEILPAILLKGSVGELVQNPHRNLAMKTSTSNAKLG